MQWDVFPTYLRRRDFGYRERPRPIVFVDGDQLELAPELVLGAPVVPSLLERLRAIIARSQLTKLEFANWVMGCSDVTLYRYLRGARIPEDRRNWLARLESAALHGEHVVAIVHCGQLAARRWPRKHWWPERRK